MRRKRRLQREIAFSFDSFLDVVANVVGVILRLILVAWVGARTYKATLPTPPKMPAALADPEPLPEPTDPREQQIARRRQELAQQRDTTSGKLVAITTAAEAARQLEADLKKLKSRQVELSTLRETVKRDANIRTVSAKQTTLTVEELRVRSKKLMEEMEALKRLPSPRKELRYRTPVSAPVQTEEMMFECHHGKVSLIDHGAMLAEVKREVRSKEDALRRTFQVSDLTAPVGAYRMRYFVERERGALESPGVTPSDGPFRYGMTGWEIVPILADRGESAEKALAAGSEFRRIIDAIEAQQTAVTFWVYPDSFALYRTLRDYLHEKDIVVAGRPLLDGMPIASSRHGTTSRGQ